jgi:hypothetical protein
MGHTRKVESRKLDTELGRCRIADSERVSLWLDKKDSYLRVWRTRTSVGKYRYRSANRTSK